MAGTAVEYDAQGNVIPASSGNATEYDADGKPLGAPAPSQPEGFWHSLGSQLGLTPEAAQAAADEMKAHPLKETTKALLGPVGPLVEGMYNQAKQTGSELSQAYQSVKQGNPAEAGVHAIQAVPIVGPAISKAADQYGQGNYLGEAGTLTGAAAQAAPLVLAGADTIAPGRPLVPNPSLPSRANAASVFNNLNTKLSDQPVPLKATIAPLQRATEVGARGGTLPKAVTDLLQRSQAIEPMTFPEARDYQMSLTDLSRADKDSISPRMKGQIAQINQGLFNDIHAAAEAKEPGLGGDFADAMKEYRQASQIKNALTTAGKYAVPIAATAAAGATGGIAARYLTEIQK